MSDYEININIRIDTRHWFVFSFLLVLSGWFVCTGLFDLILLYLITLFSGKDLIQWWSKR